MFSVGHKLLAEDVSQNKITFLAVDALVVNGCVVTKPRKRIVAPFLSEYSAHPRYVHISWPCSVAKSFGSICLHRKEQRAAEKDFLAKLQRFFTCPTTFSRVRRSSVERRPRVIKDKTPKNMIWLVLDHHPLYRTGRVSKAISKMFEGILLKHRVTTLGVIQNILQYESRVAKPCHMLCQGSRDLLAFCDLLQQF